MRTKSSNVILLTALFLACGIGQLNASGSNSDDDKALAGANPRETPATTASKPGTAEALEPAWKVQARKTLEKKRRLERELREERIRNR